MKQYRLPFFEALAGRLGREGIDLQVVYGTPWAEEAKRNDHVDLTSAIGLKVNSLMLGGKLLLIPVIRPWLSADLVVVEHANKNLLNYLLALLSQLRLKRVAYWGHGRDRQADPASRAEGLKRRSLHWADWWFAYTDDAARYVAGQGFDAARITTVHNA
ncbi:glycosyltransferase, partial [Achromobacter sp.]|uniref:glycosyltransferase n=1 Tax=Achromobacter sp. TaxID=134375 RepID=UPI002F95DA5F